jgi:hypothetical protein
MGDQPPVFDFPCEAKSLRVKVPSRGVIEAIAGSQGVNAEYYGQRAFVVEIGAETKAFLEQWARRVEIALLDGEEAGTGQCPGSHSRFSVPGDGE